MVEFNIPLLGEDVCQTKTHTFVSGQAQQIFFTFGFSSGCFFVSM
jgi:hypothetical protein